jgi:UDP-N-acetylmuramoylalanine--D-glutamate ligase
MNKNLNRFKNKKIAFLGLGSENVELLRFFLAKKLNAEFTICDAKKKKDLSDRIKEFQGRKNISWQMGLEHDRELDKFDIILRVAGYPLFSPALKKAVKAGVEISSPTKVFFELAPTKNIIGVTGSKGKGTTSGLIYEILKTAGKGVYWGGNIGIPMFSFFKKLEKQDWVVLELSSFQLEDIKESPQIAVITNLFREHLSPADPVNPNYHKSMADYINAKLNIIKFQKRGDLAAINKKIKKAISKEKAKLGQGKKVYFTDSDFVSRLPGKHNRENIAAATVVAKHIGIREALIRKAIKKFRGLPHRIELAGVARDIRYYDDSFATTPESSIIALRSFDTPIVLWQVEQKRVQIFKNLREK